MIALSLAGYQLTVSHMCVKAQRVMNMKMLYLSLLSESGLQYKDLIVGTGPEARDGATAVVHYTGWLLDGTKFDSSLDRGVLFEFVIGQGRVIAGWDEGVGTMNVGGKRELIIPPNLAYGDGGAGGVIPAGATLRFEVELIELK